MTIAVSTTADRAMLPKSVRLHETDDILREQLEYLIDHAGDKIVPGCSECRRYLRVRSLLLRIFRTSENERAQACEAKAPQLLESGLGNETAHP